MSSDAIPQRLYDEQRTNGRASPAADVSFKAIDTGDGEEKSESSLRSDSLRRGKQKSSEKGEKLKDRFLTPSRSTSSRQSDEDGGSGGRASGSAKHKAHKSGGWLLGSSGLSNGSAKSGTGSKSAQKRVSMESSHGSSPLSRELGRDQVMSQQSPPVSSRPTTMDPAQLVQMALSLSESRRRHTSNPMALAVPTVAPGVRHVSANARVSQHASPLQLPTSLHRDSLQESQSSRASSQIDPQVLAEAAVLDPDNTPYTFTPATLARAEKARRYFQLADEHRRLLLSLPPVDSNGKFSTQHASRQFGQELGRQYNPLQALRNRRLRQREREPLTIAPEHFQDPEKVGSWLDTVEQARDALGSQNEDYTAMKLPPYLSDRNGHTAGSEDAKCHKRTDTAGTVVTRSDNDWSIGPAELLADTYWTEQGENKFQIEDRRNRKICPQQLPVQRSVDKATSQRGSDKVPITVDNSKDDAVESTKPGPSRLLPLPGTDRIRRVPFTRLTRSSSVSSASSVEAQRPLPIYASGELENIGPLQRHMNEMIAEERNRGLASPTLQSPDHWDSRHTPFPVERRGVEYGYSEKGAEVRQNGSLIAPMESRHRRSKSADSRVTNEGRMRSSIDFSTPNSPTTGEFIRPSTDDVDSQHPHAPVHTPVKKRSRLPLFRSRSKERHNESERLDFADSPEDDRLKQLNGHVVDSTRLSVDAVRPAEVKGQKTADSATGSLPRLAQHRTNTESTGSVKEPSSAVSRFLRGGKFGDLVRNESSKIGGRFRGKDRLGEGFASDISDEDGSASEPVRGLISAEDSEASPRGSSELTRTRTKPRYHIPHLPSFKSPSVRDRQALTPIMSGDSDDHITRQQAALRYRNRSPRFERLGPPRINLPDDDQDRSPNPNLATDISDSFDERRKSYGFLNTTFRGRSHSRSRSRVPLSKTDNLSPTISRALPMPSITKMLSQPPGGHRHWSISDNRMREPPNQKIQHVNSRDIARVRTLLLASGIKAREIARRLNTPSDHPPLFLARAAETAKADLASMKRVPQKEEHLLAAHLLSEHLDATIRSLQNDFQVFQSVTLPDLAAQHEKLMNRAAEDLMHLVHNTSDSADAFNVELNTQATLRTKHVDDAVDAMLRLQRRQFRLLRRTGFKLLEWMVLSLLWCVWFVVVCIKTTKRIIVGVLTFIRWLFTF